VLRQCRRCGLRDDDPRRRRLTLGARRAETSQEAIFLSVSRGTLIAQERFGFSRSTDGDELPIAYSNWQVPI
jgi:hypothetical protein